MRSRLQRWILIIGLPLIALNVLFPRSWHGYWYYFITTVPEYSVIEMVMRLFTLLVVLIGIVLWMEAAGKPHRKVRRGIVLLGTGLIVLTMLSPTNAFLEMAGLLYFSKRWYPDFIDIPFMAFIWTVICTHMYLLFAVMSYQPKESEIAIVSIMLATHVVGQIISGFFYFEDKPLIDPIALFITSLLSIICMIVILVRTRRRLRQQQIAEKDAA